MQLALLNLLSCLFTTGRKDAGLVIIYKSNGKIPMVLSLGKLMQMPTVFTQIPLDP